MRNVGGLLYLFTHWNWKAALVVGLLRGGACVLALQGLALHARQDFGLVELAFVLATSGFSTALQQQSLQVADRRLGWVLCVLVIPYVSLGLDAGVHLWLNGSIGLRIGLLGVLFTLLSAMFHWYIMSKGAMLVGKEARPLHEDLLAMPKLAVLFVVEPMIALWKLSRGRLAPVPPAIEEAAEDLAA